VGTSWFSNIKKQGRRKTANTKTLKALTLLGGGLVGGLGVVLRKEPGEEVTILVLNNFGLVLALRLKWAKTNKKTKFEPNFQRFFNLWAPAEQQQNGNINLFRNVTTMALYKFPFEYIGNPKIYVFHWTNEPKYKRLLPLTSDLFLVLRSTKSPHLLNDHFDPELKSVNDLVV
jgi:hypothetical protein